MTQAICSTVHCKHVSDIYCITNSVTAYSRAKAILHVYSTEVQLRAHSIIQLYAYRVNVCLLIAFSHAV